MVLSRLRDAFDIEQREEVDWILGRNETNHPFSTLALPGAKSIHLGLLHWLSPIVNCSLIEWRIPKILKEAVIKPLLLEAYITLPIAGQGAQVYDDHTTPKSV